RSSLLRPQHEAPVRPIDSFALSRRDFLELSSLAAAAAALPKGERERTESLEVPTEQQAFALEEVTIAQLQDDMKSGKRTSKSITQAYLGRIAAMDQKGPTLRALLETNPDALTIAEQLDAERKQGKLRGGLHGVPVIIKDNLDTHDR